MYRLTRTAEETYMYNFVHKFTVITLYECDETGEWTQFEDTVRSLDSRTARELLGNAMADFAEDEQFFVDMLKDKIHDAITGITLRLSSDGTAQWTITSNEELTDGVRERLIDWIEGQCGDGYGEGLEQTPMYEEDDYDEVYLDEEDEEEHNLTQVPVKYSYFVKLYPTGMEVKEI